MDITLFFFKNKIILTKTLELFQPQIIKHLLRIKIVKTVREAKKTIKLRKILIIQILKNILEKVRKIKK